LAKKVGTKQSAISRLESGNYNPSVFIGLMDKTKNKEIGKAGEDLAAQFLKDKGYGILERMG